MTELERLKIENAELKHKLETRRREVIPGISNHWHGNHYHCEIHNGNYCHCEIPNENPTHIMLYESKNRTYSSLDSEVIDALARHGVPLKSAKRELEEIIQRFTKNSQQYLSSPEWDDEKGTFQRVYGVPPFSPCSFDASGVQAYDKDGKEMPHKKVVIGHLGNQTLTIDVVDRKDQ